MANETSPGALLNGTDGKNQSRRKLLVGLDLFCLVLGKPPTHHGG